MKYVLDRHFKPLGGDELLRSILLNMVRWKLGSRFRVDSGRIPEGSEDLCRRPVLTISTKELLGAVVHSVTSALVSTALRLSDGQWQGELSAR